MDLNLAIAPLLEISSTYLWPFVRIGAFVMVMPVIGGSFVPAPVRLMLALMLTFVIAPAALSAEAASYGPTRKLEGAQKKI